MGPISTIHFRKVYFYWILLPKKISRFPSNYLSYVNLEFIFLQKSFALSMPFFNGNAINRGLKKNILGCKNSSKSLFFRSVCNQYPRFRTLHARAIYITISTFTSVRPYGVGVGVGGVPLSIFKFLQSYDKVSLIKVA